MKLDTSDCQQRLANVDTGDLDNDNQESSGGKCSTSPMTFRNAVQKKSFRQCGDVAVDA
jgi:hypothetical protein